MNGTYSTSIVAPQPGSKLIDDFLRRELRVGDPRSAVEVVAALRRRYASDAARIDSEAAGLPMRVDARPSEWLMSAAVAETPGSKEERRLINDLGSDLQALIDSRDNREWAIEIRGWRDALLRELAEGTAAARFAQDPAMRDRGFLSVRRLSEYARVARLVGVLNLLMNDDYRRLAATLDDAANVVRIMMGEALYDAGLADGGVIIQVPLVDMRQRREAVIVALRRLGGLSEPTLDGEWGDDLAAYRGLLEEIDERSAPELNVYLRDELLASILDGLIGSISRRDADSLRQVAATAPVEIARMQRLLDIIASRVQRDPATLSAALAAFSESLRLFIDAFEQDRTAARLIDLAMPLPMAAAQLDETDGEGRQALLELVLARGAYAREVDCFLACCGSDVDDLEFQVKLDKFLSMLDRAVDLYCLGDSNGQEEKRAAVFRLVADVLRNDSHVSGRPTTDPLRRSLEKLSATLGRVTPTGGQVLQVFDEQFAEERDWKVLVKSLAPNCVGGRIDPFAATEALLTTAQGGPSVPHTADMPRFLTIRASLDRMATTKALGGAGSTGGGGTSSGATKLKPPDKRLERFLRRLCGLSDRNEFANRYDALESDWTDLKADRSLQTMMYEDEIDAVDDLMKDKGASEAELNRVQGVCDGVLGRKTGK
jgi:hypothetical protein